MIHVDAQHFAEVEREVLAVAFRVFLRAGIAHPDIKKAVGPKSDPAAGMILRRGAGFPDQPRRFARVRAKIG